MTVYGRGWLCLCLRGKHYISYGSWPDLVTLSRLRWVSDVEIFKKLFRTGGQQPPQQCSPPHSTELLIFSATPKTKVKKKNNDEEDDGTVNGSFWT